MKIHPYLPCASNNDELLQKLLYTQRLVIDCGIRRRFNDKRETGEKAKDEGKRERETEYASVHCRAKTIQ